MNFIFIFSQMRNQEIVKYNLVNNRNEDEEFLTIPYMLLNQAKSDFDKADNDFLIAASNKPVFGRYGIIILKVEQQNMYFVTPSLKLKKKTIRRGSFHVFMYFQSYNLVTKEKR